MDLWQTKYMDRMITDVIRHMRTGVDDRLRLVEKAQCELMATQRAIEVSLSSVNEIIYTERGVKALRVGVLLTLREPEGPTWHFHLRLRSWAYDSMRMGYGVHTIEDGCTETDGKSHISNETMHAFTLTIQLPVRVWESVRSTVPDWDTAALLDGMDQYTSGRVWAT